MSSLNPSVFHTTAVRKDAGYTHFGITAVNAGLYGDKLKDIRSVRLLEVPDQSVPIGPVSEKWDQYWGWENREGKLSMIQPSYFQLDMCFPAGLQAMVDRGEGRPVRVRQLDMRSGAYLEMCGMYYCHNEPAAWYNRTHDRYYCQTCAEKIARDFPGRDGMQCTKVEVGELRPDKHKRP